MKLSKMKDMFKVCHNPEKGVCVAWITPDDLEKLWFQEKINLGSFVGKHTDGFLNPCAISRPVFDFPKLTARSSCNFKAGDEYSFEIGENLAIARLRLRVIEFLWTNFDFMLGDIERVAELMFRYNDEFMYRYANAQALAVKAHEAALK